MTKTGREPTGNTSNGKDQRLKGPVINKTKMNKNMQRLGGRGLSLEAFANSKSGARNYNPALIKKQREFYKDAKFVSKYKKSLKQNEHFSNGFVNTTTDPQNDRDDANHEKKKKRKNKKPHMSAKELYEKTVEAEQKANTEREAARRAKEEGRQKSEAGRKTLKEKMLKKTKFGQPVMKYRIEHLLETIQSSKS